MIHKLSSKSSEQFSPLCLISGWFGIRKDFCQFLLSVFPLLQEYANIAYNNNVNRGSVPNEPPVNQEPYRDEEKKSHRKQKNQKKNEALKPVVPVTSIDMPD